MSDESAPEQIIDYNHVLYEETKGEEIDYYHDNLPHFNFYLKFQDRTFLNNFFSSLHLEGTNYERANAHIEKEEERIEQVISNVKTSDFHSSVVNNASDDLLEDAGFCIEEEEEEEEEEEKEKEKEKSRTVMKVELENPKKEKIETEISKNCYNHLMDSIKNESFHLNEHEEYTKQINRFFQKHKEQFIFSIERNTENEGVSNKCFLCNTKKKGIKTLEVRNICICKECKSLDSNFRMISFSKLINKYCLNPQDLTKYEKQLAVCSTKNPRGYTKQMKLFYIFQIKEIAIRKHGSLNNVKEMYQSKILRVHKPKTSKKVIHKLKKPRSIFSREKEETDKIRIICEENQHSFHTPICINESDNLYQKKCKNCDFTLEYIQF